MRRFAEDIYSVDVSPLSSPRFNRKVAALWTGGKARKTRGRRKRAQRGREAARPDDTVIRALTFNEAVLHTRLIYSPVQRSIVPFEPAESSRWLFKDSSVDETSDLVRVCTRFHVRHARLEDQRGWGLGNKN